MNQGFLPAYWQSVMIGGPLKCTLRVGHGELSLLAEVPYSIQLENYAGTVIVVCLLRPAFGGCLLCMEVEFVFYNEGSSFACVRLVLTPDCWLRCWDIARSLSVVSLSPLD